LLVELSNKRQGTFYHETRLCVKTINLKNTNRGRINDPIGIAGNCKPAKHYAATH